MSKEWTYPLCGCFSDCTTCELTLPLAVLIASIDLSPGVAWAPIKSLWLMWTLLNAHSPFMYGRRILVNLIAICGYAVILYISKPRPALVKDSGHGVWKGDALIRDGWEEQAVKVPKLLLITEGGIGWNCVGLYHATSFQSWRNYACVRIPKTWLSNIFCKWNEFGLARQTTMPGPCTFLPFVFWNLVYMEKRKC